MQYFLFLDALAYCYDDMDTIPDLDVTRYDSDNPSQPINPDEPWTSSGEYGPSLFIVFDEPTRVNQVEITTESGNSVMVKIGVSFKPKPSPVDLELFGGNQVPVTSGKRLDIPEVPAITNVYYLEITFYSTETLTVKVYGCIERGESVCFKYCVFLR